MKIFDYTIQDENGIHARPAGALGKEVKKYSSKVRIGFQGTEVEATKLMALMKLGVKHGDRIEVFVEGLDEDIAVEAMKEFFQQNL